MGTAKLAIIAGKGRLPQDIARHCLQNKTPHVVIGFKGFAANDDFPDSPLHIVKLGQIQAVLDLLKREQATDVVMAGHLERPSLWNLSLDKRARRILRENGLSALGDDRLLSLILNELEQAGLHIRAATDVLPGLQMPVGVPTRYKPSPVHRADIQRGRKILQSLSPFDVGQSVAIEAGYVLAVEAAEGTDAMIQRLGEINKENAAVLVKMKKAGQDGRVDLPTVGTRTIYNLAKNGFAGLAIGQATQVLEADEVVRLCDVHKLFLEVFDDDDLPSGR